MRKPRTPDDRFPYADDRVTFFCWLDGQPKHSCTVADKIAMCRSLKQHKPPYRPTLLGIWPGRTRSDVFFLDPSVALVILGGA